MITLSQEQLDALLAAAKVGVIDQNATEKPAIRELLTVHQLSGIFNNERRAVEKLGIPRVVLAVGDYRYRPEDVEEFIANRTERP